MKNNQLRSYIKEAYSVPEPVEKQAFIARLRPGRISTFRMLLQQIPYIRPYVWLLSLAVLAISIVGSLTKGEGTDELVALIMPVTAAVAMLETGRSRRYKMYELEMSTRFSLRSLVFARMTIMGLLSVLVIAIASPLIAISLGMDIVLTAETILMPYLLTMIISLHIERSPLGRENGLSSILVAAGVIFLFLVIWESDLGIIFYSRLISGGCGIAAVIILMALTLTEQWLTIKKVEAFA